MTANTAERGKTMFKLPEKIENKYRFVTLASRRAEQLQAGALPRVEQTDRKSTVIAQQEVARGLVELWRAADPEQDQVEGEEEEE